MNQPPSLQQSRHRSGQVTIFIILAAIMLLILASLIALSFWQATGSPRAPTQRAATFDSLISEIEDYIQACLQSKTTPLVISIAHHGGRLNPTTGVFHNGTELHTLCDYTKGQGCVSTLTTRHSLEQELKSAVMTEASECLDIAKAFSASGATITTKTPTLNLSIGVDAIQLLLNYPMAIQLGPNQRDLTTFSTKIDESLGRMLGTALDITNEIARTGFFDKDEYMVYHDASISIQSHRPYPHTIFQLRRMDPKTEQDFLFQFAIKGKETAGVEAVRWTPSNPCCFAKDNTCHINAPVSACAILGKTEQCQRCTANAEPEVEGCCVQSGNQCSITKAAECTGPGSQYHENDRLCSQAPGCTSLDCPSTYHMPTRDLSGPPRKNGESWCVFDGRVGAGNDLVGSRHYVHSCVRGREIVEPCRDYREELCAEEKHKTLGGEISHAACRINRFADCTTRGDANDCENKNVRDCLWLPSKYPPLKVYNRVQCVPEVAPGLPHWDGRGQGQCKGVSEDKTQSKYRRTWGHLVMWACQRAGDCGPKHNVADVLTMGGYFNPDGNVDSSKLLPAGSTRIAYPPQGWGIGTQTIPSFLPDLRNPSSGGSYAICSLWQRPGGGDCNRCGVRVGTVEHPCTEYWCRSLGANCQYKEVAGITSCISGSTGAVAGSPQVKIGKSTPGVSSKGSDAFGEQYQLQGALHPHDPWTLTLESDQDVRCKMTLLSKRLKLSPSFSWGVDLPDASFIIPTIYFSDGKPAKKHEMTIRFPSKEKLLEDIEEELEDEDIPSGLIPPSFASLISGPITVYILCQNSEGLDAKEMEIKVPHALGGGDKAPTVIEIRPREHEMPPTAATSGNTIPIAVFTDRPFSSCSVKGASGSFTKLSCTEVFEEDIRYSIGAPPGSYECAGSQLTLTSPTFTFQCTLDKDANEGRPSDLVGTPFTYVPGRPKTTP